jgi:hypothetical protein
VLSAQTSRGILRGAQKLAGGTIETNFFVLKSVGKLNGVEVDSIPRGTKDFQHYISVYNKTDYPYEVIVLASVQRGGCEYHLNHHMRFWGTNSKTWIALGAPLLRKSTREDECSLLRTNPQSHSAIFLRAELKFRSNPGLEYRLPDDPAVIMIEVSVS